MNSVCYQTLEDIEIICIDDCSTDNSLEILKSFQKRDNRIKIIEFEEHKGVSAARNAGIEAASGTYIGFVDSDDYVDLDFYEKLYFKAKETNADIVKGKFVEYINSSFVEDILNINKKINNKKNNLFFITGFCSAIYKKDLLIKNNILFKENMSNGEDGIFILDCLLKTNKNVIIDNSIAYYYFRRENSANSQLLSDKAYNSLLKSYDIILNKLSQIECQEKNNAGLNFATYFYFSNYIKLIFRTLNAENKINTVEKLIKIFKSFSENTDIVQRITCEYRILLEGFLNEDKVYLINKLTNKSFSKFMADNFRFKLKNSKEIL